MKAGRRLIKGSVLGAVGISSVLAMSSTSHARGFDLPRDLMATAKKVEALADNPGLNHKTCLPQLMAMTNELYRQDVVFKNPATGKYEPYFAKEAGLTAAEVAKGEDVIGTFFRARTKIHARFQKMVQNNEFANRDEFEGCMKAVKITQRTLRGMEDYWGIMAMKRAGRLGGDNQNLVQDTSLQTGEWPTTVTNSAVLSKPFNKADIRSGDVLLSLGSAFTASVIGRINLVDSQFSHMALVYVDDGTVKGPEGKGKAYVIEAEPDVGVRMVELDDYLKHGNIRVAAFRFQNLKVDGKATPAAEVAQRAAKYMAMRASKEVIEYNFSMNMKEESTIFCSQEISIAYNHACSEAGVRCEDFPGLQQGKEAFPFYMSKFDVNGNALVRMLGISVDETFAPGDIEYDPRFTLVGEWRNFEALIAARKYNMTLAKFMQWLERRDYVFAENVGVDALSAFATKMVADMGKMPAKMPPGFTKGTILMGYMMMVTVPAGTLATKPIAQIDPAEVKQILEKNGVPKKLIDALGDRAKDLIVKVLNNASFTFLLSNLDTKVLTAFGYYATDIAMDRQLDFILKDDCEKLQRGEPVRYHDIIVNKNDPKKCSTEIRSLKGFW